MTRNGVRVTDLLDDFDSFANKFSILADNHMAAFPGLKVDNYTTTHDFEINQNRM